LSYIV